MTVDLSGLISLGENFLRMQLFFLVKKVTCH